MKPIYFLFIVLFIACNSSSKKDDLRDIDRIIDAHGGLSIWKNYQTFTFKKGDETHTIDLKSRKTLIQHPKYKLGFDGKEVWLKQDSVFYQGNPEFYHNLYFYFVAMPFVLADDGIIYEKVKPITYHNINYPGIKISYQANVGSSPDDNYIIYYHPETFKMEWLAYTVTFNTKETSNQYNLIKYDEWVKVNSLLMPKSLIWYDKDAENNPLKAKSAPLIITNISFSKEQIDENLYQ